MKNIIKTVFSFVFSFWFMMAVAFIMLFLFFLRGAIALNEARTLADKTCYSRAMVVVETPGGLFCVDLANLVPIK